MVPHPPGCPACGSSAPPKPVEEHADPIGGRAYRLVECPACGVVWTAPREGVGADWYAKASPIRARETRPPPESDRRFQQFLSEDLKPGRLLDVGCGDGSFLKLAEQKGWKGTGFDYDIRVAAKAREAGLDVHASEFSEFCRARKAGEFDAATFFDVLEHTPEPAWFLGEVRRLLKPGAAVALTMPNALRPLPWGRDVHDFPPHHFTRWTSKAMRGFLENHGFKVVRQEAGALALRHFADHFYFHRLMPAVLPLAKKVLFGAGAGKDRTITELYDRAGGAGAFGDKLRRQNLIDFGRNAFRIFFLPAAFVLKAHYRSKQRECGDCLYTFARLKGEGR